ncbi:hypothetical protein C7M84_013219, partial [Penaeus vannamei]
FRWHCVKLRGRLEEASPAAGVELSAQDRQCCRLGELSRAEASGATGRGFRREDLIGGGFCGRFAPCGDPAGRAGPVMACFAARVGNSGMVSNWLGPISDPCQDHAKWSITARQVTANNELRCIYGVAEVASLMHGDSLTQSRRRRSSAAAPPPPSPWIPATLALHEIVLSEINTPLSFIGAVSVRAAAVLTPLPPSSYLPPPPSHSPLSPLQFSLLSFSFLSHFSSPLLPFPSNLLSSISTTLPFPHPFLLPLFLFLSPLFYSSLLPSPAYPLPPPLSPSLLSSTPSLTLLLSLLSFLPPPPFVPLLHFLPLHPLLILLFPPPSLFPACTLTRLSPLPPPPSSSPPSSPFHSPILSLSLPPIPISISSSSPFSPPSSTTVFSLTLPRPFSFPLLPFPSLPSPLLLSPPSPQVPYLLIRLSLTPPLPSLPSTLFYSPLFPPLSSPPPSFTPLSFRLLSPSLPPLFPLSSPLPPPSSTPSLSASLLPLFPPTLPPSPPPSSTPSLSASSPPLSSRLRSPSLLVPRPPPLPLSPLSLCTSVPPPPPPPAVYLYGVTAS